MTPFFITGLPRCRTAWLANLFTYGPAFCYHDGIGYCRHPQELAELLARPGALYCGDADSALVLCAQTVVEQFPEARWLQIIRPMSEALQSFAFYFRDQPYPGAPQEWEEQQEIFAMLREANTLLAQTVPPEQLMILTYDQLEEETLVREAWEFLLPQVPWNSMRFAMLNTIRMNVIPAKLPWPKFLPCKDRYDLTVAF